MIDSNATITELVNNGLLRDSAGYLEAVCGNCYRQYQERGWIGDNVRVRIGRKGKGTNPNYTIEYVSDQYAEKPFAEDQFNKRDNPQQFSGQSHKKTAIGFDQPMWSTETETLAQLEELKKRLKTGNLRLP